jgi:hypothetical protein
VLIEHRGRLIDYFRDDHPYRQIPRPKATEPLRPESHAPLPIPNLLQTLDAPPVPHQS